MENEFHKIAEEIAAQAQARVAHLEKEVFDLETRLAQKKAEYNAASLAPKRLADFQVQIGTDYQCPRCWIVRKTRSAVRPFPGGGKTHEFLRCQTCREEFAIPV